MDRRFENAACVLTVVAWVSFLLLDILWQQCLSDAVIRGRYGEVYGPLSFVRPVALYSAAVLSLVCVCLLFRRRR